MKTSAASFHPERSRGVIRHLLILLAIFLLAQPAWASWTFQAHRGSANNKISGTSISVSPTATLDVGDIIFARCVSDPFNADSNDHTSVTDSSSNSWTKVRETTGALGTGIPAISLWASKLTSSISTSGTITCTIAGSVIAKAVGIDEFTVASGKTFSVAGTAVNSASNVTTLAVTLSSLASAEYLWWGMWGVEGPDGDTYTEDADYTNRTGFGTTGGSAISNVYTRAGTRVLTATSDTYDGTLGTARDVAKILAAIQEVDEGAPPPAEPPLRRQVITRHSARPEASGWASK